MASLLLCVAAIGFWVRSYFAFDIATRSSFQKYHVIGTSRGELYLYSEVFDTDHVVGSGFETHWRVRTLHVRDILKEMASRQIHKAYGPAAGFYWGHSSLIGEDTHIVTVPMAF